jgi:ATP-binding cassette, subfamily A (ABC1), member 3
LLILPFLTHILQSSKSLYDSSNLYASSQYGAVWYTREPESVIVGGSNGTFIESIESQCRTFVQNGLNYTSEEDCLRFRGYGYVIQYNFTGLHVGPLFQSVADQALLRYATNDKEITISTTIAPLPITQAEERYGAAEDLVLVWFMIMFVFPFIAAAFASFIVLERESKAKHLQTVAGVEPSSYWISTFLWDTMNYQLPLWFIVILMFIFKVDALTTSTHNTFSGVLAILFFYGPASAGFAYCWSFAFKSPSLCFVFLIVSGIIIGFGGTLTVFILLEIGKDPGNPKDNLVNVAHILTWLLRFFPSFCLGKGLWFAISSEIIFNIEGDSETSVWSEPILLVEVIFLILQMFGYTGLAICLDIWSSNPRIMSYWNSFLGMFTCSCLCPRKAGPDITTALPDDEDVLNEQNRVLSGGANSDLIVLSQLSKVYANGKIAVNNLSLGIPHGECFGLLGINGAFVAFLSIWFSRVLLLSSISLQVLEKQQLCKC